MSDNWVPTKASLDRLPKRRNADSFRVSRKELRRLVDIVWNEATESTAVPSTNWADRLIARALTPAPRSLDAGQ